MIPHSSMRVYLRALDSGDIDVLFPWLVDDEIQAFTGGNTYFASRDYVANWLTSKILSKRDIYLAICLKDTGAPIGYLSINDIDHRNRKAVWGGLLIGNKEWWSKGIGTEAAQMMLQYVFDELNINLFWGLWLEEHTRSLKLGRKIGFKDVGVLKQSVYKRGRYHNQIIMALLKEEYDARKRLKGPTPATGDRGLT